MIRYTIRGGKSLNGEVTVSGAKNAAVAIIPAAVLVNGKCTIENVPDISDVRTLIGILRDLGATVEYKDRTTVVIDCSNINGNVSATSDGVRQMRASYYLIGALLGRFGKATVGLPGGCAFDARPIDQHIKGFRLLGADVDDSDKMIRCNAENGLTGTGVSALAKACGCTKGNLYAYFKSLDELIIESTAYCMEKVEDDFMEMAPTDPNDVVRFVKEVPYWTAEKHGKKYRLMYQIYTHPKYIEHGKKFFEGVNERYTEYAKLLEPKIGIPYTVITPLIFIFVRACVHYAMFEDEYYLKTQMEVLKQGVALFVDKYKANQA